MFLATKELKYAKSKFALIIFLIILISYLVYFLTSLAYGLASSYTNAIDLWEADEVILTVDANDNMMMSFMDNSDFSNLTVNGDKAKLGIFPAVVNNPLLSYEEMLASRIEVYFFGIENESFLKPTNITLSGNLVVVDETFKKEGYKIGDEFGVSGGTDTYIIKGFVSKATYQTAPVVYMDLDTWQNHRYGSENPLDRYSSIIVRGTTSNVSNGLVSYQVKDYVNTLPGYNAQVLTFTVMIAFLIIIVAFVLGIFIYVLTIQKTSMFGVMKAQGISNFYIGNSVVVQTMLLVGIGVVFGLILTTVTTYFLSDIVPLATNILFYLIITAAFFLFALLGGLFSVKAVLKIDPLEAIGG